MHTHKPITAVIAALALALGTAAPAVARPFITDAQGSNVPAPEIAQPPVQATSHHTSGGGFDWGYVAAGTGAVSLALIGMGGTVVGRRQRRTRSSAIAA